MSISSFLAFHRFEFPKYEHLATKTCFEFESLVANIPGTRNKNLFLRDKKAHRHVLVVVQPTLEIDLDQLSTILGIKTARFCVDGALTTISWCGIRICECFKPDS